MRDPLSSNHVLQCRCELLIFRCFKCRDRAQLSFVSRPPLDLNRVSSLPAYMSTSTTQDERSPPSGRKRTCSGALQLGPRKKPYVVLISNVLIVSLLCTRTSQDPLVHHGRHFGRAVHAFCNVQTLVVNGLQAMCDDAPEDEGLTAVCVPYAISLSRQLLTLVSANARSTLFSASCFDRCQA